jgi:hypothetical protein
LYYDSSLAIATDVLNGGPLNISQFTSGIHAPFPSLLSYGFLPDLQLPRVIQWNIAVERALGSHSAISASYVGAQGRDLLRREVGGTGSTQVSMLTLTTNRGASDYNGLQLQYRRVMARGWQALVSYSWSHSIDNASSDAFLLWAGPGAAAPLDRGSSDFDLRHSLRAAISYETPSGHWGFDALFQTRTGFPISVLTAEQYNGLVLSNAFRPDVNPSLPIWISDPDAPGSRRLNAAAFTPAPAARQGDLGRNSISGFGMSQVDLAARRRFRVTERGSLEVRLEVFNALNEPNFGDPVKYLNSPLFGQSTSMLNLMLGSGSPGSGLAPLLQSGGSRSMQVCVRFAF